MENYKYYSKKIEDFMRKIYVLVIDTEQDSGVGGPTENYRKN